MSEISIRTILLYYSIAAMATFHLKQPPPDSILQNMDGGFAPYELTGREKEEERRRESNAMAIRRQLERFNTIAMDVYSHHKIQPHRPNDGEARFDGASGKTITYIEKPNRNGKLMKVPMYAMKTRGDIEADRFVGDEDSDFIQL